MPLRDEDVSNRRSGKDRIKAIDKDMSTQRIFFITGASRSGTTLLSFVLRKHPHIFGLKELQYFGEFCRPGQLSATLSEEQYLRAGAAIFARQRDGILEPQITTDDYRWAREIFEALPDDQRTAAGFFAAAVANLSAYAGKTIPCEQTPRNIFYAEELLATFEEYDSNFLRFFRLLSSKINIYSLYYRSE